MDQGMSVAVSAQLALERRLNTLADNVANANSAGFRATQIRFEEAMDASQPVAGGLSYVTRGRSFADTRQGAVDETGGRLDFAINGQGWFGIATPSGTAVTRDGRFQMEPDGRVVTLTGHAVLDAAGGEIRVDPNAGPVKADGSGRLRQGEATAGQIGVFAFEPQANTRRAGTSAYLTGKAPQPILDSRDTSIIQGSIERSNVNPVQEMTRLIAIHRAFDNVAAMLRDTEGAQEAMIRTFGGSR